MKIHLPNSAFLGNLDTFLRTFDNFDPKTLQISANKRWISIHPVVLSMVAAIGIELEPENITCEKLEATSKHYLERMGLFKFLRISSNISITEHESAGRFIPLTQISDSKDLTSFISEMVPLLHLETQQAEPIKYVISELVRNVLEHSQSSSGAILCAQFYKKSNSIRIGIVDRGVGIKTTIGHAHDAPTDLSAIKLALTPGITGTTRKEGGTDYNAGAGLFFIKSIAKVNRDFFIIYSGKTMYKLLKSSSKTKEIRLYGDPFRDRHSANEDFPFWKGTVVGIDIILDSKSGFNDLLDLIRKVYFKTIMERKKERYKKPKFI